MSYKTIARNAEDIAFQARVTAACAQESVDPPGITDPVEDMRRVIWSVVTAADVEAAYESAIIANNPDPGGDPAVVTDGMILAKVQAVLPTLP